MLNQSHILSLVNKLIIKILHFILTKLVILLEYQNIKTFLLKALFQIGLKMFLLLKKVKSAVPETYVISDIKAEETVGTFYLKELQKTNENSFELKKIIKRKGCKLYVKWKGYNSSFNSCIDKKSVV